MGARCAFAGALIAGVVAGCQYDYEALKGIASGDAGANPGSAGSVGAGGAGGEGGDGGGAGPGAGGDGRGGAVAIAGRGGTAGGAGAGGGAGSGDVGGSAGGMGGASGEGGAGGSAAGAGGSAGGTGGTSGKGGAVGAAGAGGSAGGAGGKGGAAGAGGSAGGTGGAAGGGGGGTGGLGGQSGAGGGGDVLGDLVLWYKFDDGSGTVALDSSSAVGAPRNGMLVAAGVGGAVAFSTTRRLGTHAVNLTANGMMGGGYVVVPSLHDLAPSALTISTWVRVTAAQRWQRVFDLGNSTTSNLALTTQNGTDQVRFVIRTGGVEQQLASTVVLSPSAWHHLAVVLPGGAPYTGRLYIDGVLAATNTAMTFHAADLGATTGNFLGKSQFAADPYFAGAIDDFRVYRRALGPEQIAALFGAP